MRSRRLGGRAGAAVWSAPLLVLLACKSTTPRPAAKAEAAPKPAPAEVRAGESGASEPDARSSESDARPSEPGARPSETGDDAAASGTGTGASETGEPPAGGARLCARPYDLSATPGKGSRAPSPGAQDYAEVRRQLERGFEVSVDDRPAQAWTSRRGVAFDGLDPATRHTIHIREPGGAKVKAMVLDFERRGSHDLCLGLSSFYMTWQLRSLRAGAVCGPCTTRAPR